MRGWRTALISRVLLFFPVEFGVRQTVARPNRRAAVRCARRSAVPHAPCIVRPRRADYFRDAVRLEPPGSRLRRNLGLALRVARPGVAERDRKVSCDGDQAALN